MCGNAFPELSTPIWQRASVSHLLVNMFQTSVNCQNSGCCIVIFHGYFVYKIKIKSEVPYIGDILIMSNLGPKTLIS